mmetsp:Transcript_3258/g.5884  ORF Transcript_3258/g.5884 Transcript_3258/m.5884 type:complete len:231 (+) Transcript_3258:793-1485(+)
MSAPSKETLDLHLGHQITPQRQPRQRIALGDRPDALPQPFGVEAEHRRQVGPLRCRQHLAAQVVQDQRLRARLGIVGQHHMRQRLPAQPGPHIDHAQLGGRHAGGRQAEVLADGVVLAVTSPLVQALERRGPVVGHPPDHQVLLEFEPPVEEVVDVLQPLKFVQRAVALDLQHQGLGLLREPGVARGGHFQHPRRVIGGQRRPGASQQRAPPPQASAQGIGETDRRSRQD